MDFRGLLRRHSGAYGRSFRSRAATRFDGRGGPLGIGPRGLLGHAVPWPDLPASRVRRRRGMAPPRARRRDRRWSADRTCRGRETELPGVARPSLPVRGPASRPRRIGHRRRGERHPARRLRAGGLSAMAGAGRLRSRAGLFSDQCFLRGPRGPGRAARARAHPQRSHARRAGGMGVLAASHRLARQRPRPGGGASRPSAGSTTPCFCFPSSSACGTGPACRWSACC